MAIISRARRCRGVSGGSPGSRQLFFWSVMIVSARCSFRCSRRFSASSCFTRGSTGLGLGPRRRPRMSCKAPCSRCRRQLVSKDEYNPSRRNRAPSSPGFLQASACVRMRSRYSAGKRRRWAFAGTSGSGSVARDVTEGPKAAVALRAPFASAPSATSISTAAGMRVIHRTLPAPTLISPGRLSHGLLAQGDARCGRSAGRSASGRCNRRVSATLAGISSVMRRRTRSSSSRGCARTGR